MRLSTTAVLLVGGMGTRLRPAFSTGPKPMASVGGATFLDLLVRQLRHQGIREIVMCTGHMAGQIESEFRDGSSRDVRIQYSREERALGTGGAVKLAEPYLQGMPDFLVMNGDSFVEIDLQEFVSFHRERGGLATIAAWEAANSARYGTIRMGEDFRVTGFLEKTGNEASGLINAGVYIFNNDVLSQLPEGPSSLERDLFPRLLDHGVYAVPQRGIFIDIGTPEDYAHAQALYNQIESAAVRGTQAGIDEA